MTKPTSQLKIMTSSWYAYKGPGRIGISVGSPRGMPAGYKLYRALAPTRDMLKMPIETYRPKFFNDILGKLDPDQVLKDLEAKSEDGLAVLLCFEKPPFTDINFCHRHMVADWLKDMRGIEVLEWSGAKETNLGQPALDV